MKFLTKNSSRAGSGDLQCCRCFLLLFFFLLPLIRWLFSATLSIFLAPFLFGTIFCTVQHSYHYHLFIPLINLVIRAEHLRLLKHLYEMWPFGSSYVITSSTKPSTEEEEQPSRFWWLGLQFVAFFPCRTIHNLMMKQREIVMELRRWAS